MSALMTASPVKPYMIGAIRHRNAEWKAGAPIEERVEQRNPVDRRQRCRTEHAPFAAGDLHKAETSAAAQRDVFRDPFGRQAHAEPFVQVRRLPTRFLQLERQQHILRYALGGKASDLLQSLATRDRGGAAAECYAPGVLGREQHIEEEALLVRPSARRTKAMLERVWIKKALRRLDATDLLIPEQCKRAAQELGLLDKIGVEYGYQFARFLTRKLPQRVIDVAGLRMLIARAGDVPDIAPFTEVAQPIAAPIIQNENAVVIVML